MEFTYKTFLTRYKKGILYFFYYSRSSSCSCLFCLNLTNQPYLFKDLLVLWHHKNLVVGTIVKHLNCYCLLGAAAPLTNRDCSLLRAPTRVSFFQPSPQDRLTVVLKLRYLALNCKVLKRHFTGITLGAAFFSMCPLSCFVNTLKVSEGINWSRIRVDVNEPVPFVILETYGYF